MHGDCVPQDRLSDGLGSIEVFPRKTRAASTNTWRSAPLRGNDNVRVRAARLEDYAAVRALQRLSDDGIAQCALKQFENRRARFAEGQLIAECEGEIVGAASSLVVRWQDGSSENDWKAITGEGTFSTHDPRGGTLFAPETWIDFARGGLGVARALTQARRKLCRRLNLRRILLAAPLATHGDEDDDVAPHDYAERVVRGEVDDAGLRLNLAQGYQYCGVLRNYFPQQASSPRHAALFVWLNPLYAPPRPPAFETERPRKCA